MELFLLNAFPFRMIKDFFIMVVGWYGDSFSFSYFLGKQRGKVDGMEFLSQLQLFHLLLSEIDSCSCLKLADQCQNGATCVDDPTLSSSTSCSCPCGYSGSKCEIAISECCNYGSTPPNSCLNGGTCEDTTPGSPQCQCGACYTGEFCDTGRYIVDQCFSPVKMVYLWNTVLHSSVSHGWLYTPRFCFGFIFDSSTNLKIGALVLNILYQYQNLVCVLCTREFCDRGSLETVASVAHVRPPYLEAVAVAPTLHTHVWMEGADLVWM